MALYHKLEQGLAQDAAPPAMPSNPSSENERTSDTRSFVGKLWWKVAAAAVMFIGCGTVVVVGIGAFSSNYIVAGSAKEHAAVVNPGMHLDQALTKHCFVSCVDDETSLKCRACLNQMLEPEFCHACTTVGLNDVGCRACPREVDEHPVVVGGDADKHDCRASAGYMWCQQKSSCIRPWEIAIHSKDDFEAVCGSLAPRVPSVVAVAATPLRSQAAPQNFLGGDRDEHGCIASAGYSWCESMKLCIRPWEHAIRSQIEFDRRCSQVPNQAHGCHASAGFRWCSARSECIRAWDHGITTEKHFANACAESTERATHLCNCPPSEAMWHCSESEFDNIQKGITCPFYKSRFHG